MKISIIVAVAKNNIIGRKNKLPWYLPADLAHFRNTTLGHFILMGQKTYESVGHPLIGRTMVILTDDLNYKQKDCIVVHSPEEAIKIAKNAGETELFICGGGMVYKTFLLLADKIYLTRVKAKIEGDIYFPIINKKEWKIVSSETYPKDEKNVYDYEFQVLERL